jgi:glycosyltransferase involved in cell wall biosynthesis
MHIVIDARHINSSTGHYVERLLDELQYIDGDNSYTVIVLEKEKNHWKPSCPNFSVLTTNANWYTFSEQLRFASLLYSLKPDFVHFSMPQQPLLWKGRRLTTVHDTTLIRYENVDQNKIIYKGRKFIFTNLLRNVMKRSDYILAPTNYVKDDLDEWTDHHYSKKLVVTYESGDMIHAEPEPVKKLKGKRFLFFVGNAFPYKNLGRIVSAYAELKFTYPDLQLVFAGKKDFFYEQLEADVKQRKIPEVHFLGYISDGEKRWIMKNATAYVCASLSEGFHIPMIEAMYEQCPVISSDATCLPEVGGDAALYFNPSSTDELVAAVTRLLEEPKLRDQLIKKGSRNIKRFSWKKMAEETYKIYQKMETK